jgi:hypothetical protein
MILVVDQFRAVSEKNAAGARRSRRFNVALPIHAEAG